jgi:hypothetical protein
MTDDDTPSDELDAKLTIGLGEADVRRIIREEIERARKEDAEAIRRSRGSFKNDDVLE